MKIKLIYAKDERCVDCGEQAVAFFPACDPDIPQYTYCRKCLDKRKERLMMELLKIK